MTTRSAPIDLVQCAVNRANWFVPRRGRGRWLIASSLQGLTAYRALASGAYCHIHFESEAAMNAFRALVETDPELAEAQMVLRVGTLDQRDGEPSIFDVVIVDELAAQAGPVDLLGAARSRVAESGRLGLAVNLAEAPSLASYVFSAMRDGFAPVRADIVGSEFYMGLERSSEALSRWQSFDEEHAQRILSQLFEHDRTARRRLEELERVELDRSEIETRTSRDLLKSRLALDEARRAAELAESRATALEAQVAKSSRLAEHVEALERSKASQEGELARLREELKSFETMKLELSDQLGDESLATSLISGLTQMAGKVSELSVKLNGARVEASEHTRAIEAERGEMAARLRAESDTRQQVELEVIRLETQLGLMERGHAELGTLVDHLKEALKEAERAHSRSKAEMLDMSARADDEAVSTAKLDAVTNQAARLEVEANTLRSGNQALGHQLADARKAIEEARAGALRDKQEFEEQIALLRAELSRTNEKLAGSQQEAKGSEERNRRLLEDLRETQTRLEQLRGREAASRDELKQRLTELARIEASLRYRLGTRLVDGAKSVLSAVGLKRFRRARASTPVRKQVDSSGFEQALGLPDLSAVAVTKPRLAIIADEFTTSCFEPDVDLLVLDLEGFADQIRHEKPDLVLVESAWAGNQGNWHYRIAKYSRNMGDELRDMLAIADEEKVPSLFWNKEDPVHFERFIDSAKKCDIILTTDEQCVPRYIAETGKNRVDAMPFAAQPAIHNPLQEEVRLNNPCFAGTYYGSRHQQRGADMLHLLEPAIDFGLHIYDRRHGYAGKDAEQFRFPDIFQPCIQGKLAYDEMTRAYKRYRAFLNVNSVTTSRTMFSRRVFELLACGTPVISSYSEGIEDLLGDVVFISNSEAETRAALERLSDDDAWAKASLAGMRRVFADHTYEHRLEFMLEKAGLPRPSSRRASFIAMARLETTEQLARLRDHLHAQSYKPRAIFVLSDTLEAADLESLSAASSQALVRQFPPDVDLRDLARLMNTFNGAYIVRFDAGRGYGRHYLSDLKDALLYTQPAFFGRHSHYIAGIGTDMRLANPGWEHRHATGAPGGSLAARCGTLNASLLRDVMFKNWFRVPGGSDLVSLSRYGFVDHHPDATQVALQQRSVRDALETGGGLA